MTDARGVLVELHDEETRAEGGNGAGEVATLPRDTAPTFELEMLVSGAVLVGLFQLAGALDAVETRWLPHLTLAGFIGVGLLATYVRAAIFALIGCFITHLALRGYWVALVAVNSMFPRGVRWERAKETGPITRSLLQARLRPLGTFAARYDNAASLVFATGFILALASLSSLAVLAAGAVIFAVVRTLHVPRPEIAVVGVVSVIFAAMLGGALADYRAGDRLGGRPAAVVRGLSYLSQRIQPASLSSLIYVVRTNVDTRMAYGVGMTGLLLALGAAIAVEPRPTGPSLPNSGAYRFFADESESRSVHAQFYDALRGDDPASFRAPSIQSDVITDPYVRLFVPYVPSRHEAALTRVCPGLAPAPVADSLGESTADATADAHILQCAALLHRPALDGRPLDSLGFHFFSDPRTNRRGFRMLIPATGLAAGEHRITVWPAPAPGRTASGPYVIPFWR
ncbi:hypothetical protein tb265_29000 [Gemmatimonadetes bacterium T265]|nr:hypothetical protein tb265_29000 [Gemmatimonadetes bacterium T265]